MKKYAKYDNGDTIWEVLEDEDKTLDIYIDDIQGDIMICDIDKSKLDPVTKDDYDKRIAKLKIEYS